MFTASHLLLFLVFGITQGGVLYDPSKLDEANTSLSCSVDGKIVPNGQNFTTKRSGPCIKYKCQNRAFIPIDIRCRSLDNSCVSIGHKLKISKCMVQQCERVGQSIGFTLLKEGCETREKGCIGVNKTYQEGCNTYTCFKKGNLYHTEVTDWGCKHDGKCIKGNGTVKSQCTLQRCEKRDIMVGLYTIDTGCQFIDGTCLKLGEMRIHNCLLFNCETDLASGRAWYTARQKAAMCEDYKGSCHSNGGKMKIATNGSGLIDCTCVIDGLNVARTCP